MAWAGGTQTITVSEGILKVVTTNFDADAEVATVIDLHTYMVPPYPFRHYPQGKDCQMQAVRTGGATDTVAISLQGSIDGVQYRDIIDITKTTQAATADTTSGCAYNNDLLYARIRYLRIYTTTVGAGNTLTATAWIAMPNN